MADAVESRNGATGSGCDDAAVHSPIAAPIRLAVVDDHPVIALAIEAVAAGAGDGDRPVRVVGVARTPEAGVALVRTTGPDAPEVALCDIQLRAGTDGLQVVDAAVTAGCRVIVLTSFDRSTLMRAAFERGAAGFLDKGADVAAILAAVRTVAAGGTAFSAATLDAARFAPRTPSGREIQVLTELRDGATSDEIGARLQISARTVESHLRRLFDRYGVVSRTELAVLAVREGWIDAGPG
jgi:DNA-binding NarL/FixJ family response regulator